LGGTLRVRVQGDGAFADSEIKRLMPPLQIGQSVKHEFPFERR
jgi:hypothetical protein